MDRPKISESYIARAAAEDLLPELMEWANAADSERGRYLADATGVMQGASFSNGYELAKRLERNGYEPDAQLVEILDGAYSLLSDRHQRAVREWVKGWNIKVPWRIGDAVRVKFRGKDVSGVVARVMADEALCVVRVVELGHAEGCGLVVNSEDVTPESAMAQVTAD